VNELFRRVLGLPEQASSIAYGIDVLHYVVITVSLLGAAGVAAAVALLLFRFRARRGPAPAHVHPRAPVWLEAAVIAGLLAMFLAFWVVGFRQLVRIQAPPPGAMNVYVVGKQWMWTFAYPDGTATIGDLYVPVGKPVRLLMTSRDVIHSFFVPDFRIKQDVLPGRTLVAWFEATRAGPHDILCAEYCGLEHSRMRGRVIALAGEDWARWAEARPAPTADLATAGGRIAADRGCLRCHTVDGAPHLGPTWAGLYGATVPLEGGGAIRADEAYLTESMMDPERRIHAGYPPIMPPYRGLLDGAEVAALVEYIRSLPARAAPASPPPVAPLPTAPIVEPAGPAAPGAPGAPGRLP
jgi:cytochrome c oxidase subunit 2